MMQTSKNSNRLRNSNVILSDSICDVTVVEAFKLYFWSKNLCSAFLFIKLIFFCLSSYHAAVKQRKKEKLNCNTLLRK